MSETEAWRVYPSPHWAELRIHTHTAVVVGGDSNVGLTSLKNNPKTQHVFYLWEQKLTLNPKRPPSHVPIPVDRDLSKKKKKKKAHLEASGPDTERREEIWGWWVKHTVCVLCVGVVLGPGRLALSAGDQSPPLSKHCVHSADVYGTSVRLEADSIHYWLAWRCGTAQSLWIWSRTVLYKTQYYHDKTPN